MGGGNLLQNIVFARELWGAHFLRHRCHIFRAPRVLGIIPKTKITFVQKWNPRTARAPDAGRVRGASEAKDGASGAKKGASGDERRPATVERRPPWRRRRRGEKTLNKIKNRAEHTKKGVAVIAGFLPETSFLFLGATSLFPRLAGAPCDAGH